MTSSPDLVNVYYQGWDDGFRVAIYLVLAFGLAISAIMLSGRIGKR